MCERKALYTYIYICVCERESVCVCVRERERERERESLQVVCVKEGEYTGLCVRAGVHV